MSTYNESAAKAAVQTGELDGHNSAVLIGPGVQNAGSSSDVQTAGPKSFPAQMVLVDEWGSHRAAIHGRARSMFGDLGEDVKDILQDTYVKYWRCKGTMPTKEDFGHLARMLGQVGKDYIRRRDAGKRKEKMAVSLDQLVLDGYEPFLESPVELEAESKWIEEKIRTYRDKCTGKMLICFRALVERSFGKVPPRELDKELGKLSAIFGPSGTGKRETARRCREISRIVGIVREEFRRFCRSNPKETLTALPLQIWNYSGVNQPGIRR